MKGIAAALLSRAANVEAGRDVSAAFTILSDDTIRATRKVNGPKVGGCRCLLSNHACKETREGNGRYFHVCFPT